MGVNPPAPIDPLNDRIVATDQLDNGTLGVQYAFQGSEYWDDYEWSSQTAMYNWSTGQWVEGAIPSNSRMRLPGSQSSGGKQAWIVRTSSAYYQDISQAPYSGIAYFYLIPRPAQPGISAPPHGSVSRVSVKQLPITWTASMQDAYEVRVLNSSGAIEWQSGQVYNPGLRSLTATLATLGNKTVQIRVAKQDADGPRLWSNTYGYANTETSWAAHAVLVQPATPVVTVPTNGATTYQATQTLTWTAPLQQGYIVRVMNGASVEWTSGDVTTTTKTLSVPLPNLGSRTIDVQVRQDGVWSDRQGVTITRLQADSPAITAPANGASFAENTRTVTWTATNQDAYEVRVLNGSGVVQWTSGDVTSTVRTLNLPFPIMGVKTVDIRVRYAGVWSNRTSISVERTAPGTPAITSPANGATFSTVAQTVNWTSERQEVYELRIVHAASGVVEWISGEVASVATSRAISFPNLGTKYIDLRVRDSSVWSTRTAIGVYVSPTPVITSLTGGVVAAANEPLVGNHSTPFEGDDYQAAVKSRWRIVGAGTWTDGAAQSGGQAYYTYPSNLAVGNYERQVAVSLNATGEWSPWSASGLFTVFVRPPMPAIVVPVPNTTVADRVNVEWTAPSQDAYEIQVRNGLTVEWTSGVVVSNPLRTAEVLFPTLGERQVYLRVRNNTLWSNEGPGRSWVTLPVSVVATPVTSLDRVIDPFVATSLGYDTVNLTWTPPLSATWSGYRIVRSRSGYPTTEEDGLVAHQVLGGTWATDTGYANTDLPGGWHYYTFFLLTADGSTWVRVATTDVLVPYDYGTTDKLWDTIPDYYKHIRDDSADQSTKNLRINPELYLSNDYSAPNLLLSSFLHLFGIGLDHVRTQVEHVVSGYGSNDVHISRLNLLAQQFGRDLEQAVPAYANRTVVRNLAYLYRKRGTLDGIAELATMATGWDVEVTLGPNQMLNEDQAALANPEYDKWDAARYYTPGIRVEYGSYIFENILASSGAAQAPANSGVNNTWWNALAVPVNDRTLARVDTGDVSTWQYNLSPGGVLSGKTAIGVGVVDPVDPLMFQTNALVLERTDANGATNITAMSIPTVAAAGQTIDTKRQVLEAGIPLPDALPYEEGRFYPAGSLVEYSGSIREAIEDTVAPPHISDYWTQVSAPGEEARLRLSVYAHGPFSGTGGTGARSVTLVVRQYDADGVFISELSGVDNATSSGAVGAAWTRPYFTFAPAANARYLGVGARVASPGLNEKQYLTKWMLERPGMVVTTPSTYSKAREAQVLVKADQVNLVVNPSFGVNTTGWSAGTETAIARNTVTFYNGTASMSLTAGAGVATPGKMNALHSGGMPVYGGAAYTVQARFRAAATARQVQVGLQWRDGAAVPIGAEVLSPVVSNTTGGWTQVVLPLTAPVGAEMATLKVYVLAPVAGEIHYVDAVAFTQGASAPPYFDGSTTTDAVWEGTAHNSRSHYYENRLERLPALARALSDTVPLGIGVGVARFGVWTD